MVIFFDWVIWVFDFIDGMVNFVYGILVYVVLIGVQVGGIMVVGVVVDVVVCMVYLVVMGFGVYFIDEWGRYVLWCIGVDELLMVLLGIGFGYLVWCCEKQVELLVYVVLLVCDVCWIGFVVLDLCMVVVGWLDVYYEYGVQVWDCVVGVLIVVEVGVCVLLLMLRVGGVGLVVVVVVFGIVDELLVVLQ